MAETKPSCCHLSNDKRFMQSATEIELKRQQNADCLATLTPASLSLSLSFYSNCCGAVKATLRIQLIDSRVSRVPRPAWPPLRTKVVQRFSIKLNLLISIICASSDRIPGQHRKNKEQKKLSTQHTEAGTKAEAEAEALKQKPVPTAAMSRCPDAAHPAIPFPPVVVKCCGGIWLMCRRVGQLNNNNDIHNINHNNKRNALLTEETRLDH